MGDQVVTYPAAFFAGLVSFVSPCVLPVIPGYLSFISGVSAEHMQDPARRSEVTRRVAVNSLFFVLGLLLLRPIDVQRGAREAMRLEGTP